MNEDFAAINRLMKELGLERDKPYATPPAPTWEQELNAKLQPRPAPIVPLPDWDGGC